MEQRRGSAASRENLTQVERDCLRVASERSLRLFKPASRRQPPRWATNPAGPHFFPGTVEALRKRRLIDCEDFDGEARYFATREGLDLLGQLPPDIHPDDLEIPF